MCTMLEKPVLVNLQSASTVNKDKPKTYGYSTKSTDKDEFIIDYFAPTLKQNNHSLASARVV